MVETFICAVRNDVDLMSYLGSLIWCIYILLYSALQETHTIYMYLNHCERAHTSIIITNLLVSVR